MNNTQTDNQGQDNYGKMVENVTKIQEKHINNTFNIITERLKKNIINTINLFTVKNPKKYKIILTCLENLENKGVLFKMINDIVEFVLRNFIHEILFNLSDDIYEKYPMLKNIFKMDNMELLNYIIAYTTAIVCIMDNDVEQRPRGFSVLPTLDESTRLHEENNEEYNEIVEEPQTPSNKYEVKKMVTTRPPTPSPQEDVELEDIFVDAKDEPEENTEEEKLNELEQSLFDELNEPN